VKLHFFVDQYHINNVQVMEPKEPGSHLHERILGPPPTYPRVHSEPTRPSYWWKAELANGVERWFAGDEMLFTSDFSDDEQYIVGWWMDPQTYWYLGMDTPTDDGPFMSVFNMIDQVEGLDDLQSVPIGLGVFRQFPAPEGARADTSDLLPLDQYDRFIVSYSGGKDSTAILLHLLDLGVPKEKIELWHQSIDGNPSEAGEFFDWPVTPAYCSAFAEAMDLKLLYQWREGGFWKELNLDNEEGGRIVFDDGDGNYITPARYSTRPRTRRKFPQVSADLRYRWCSPYLKIDVAERAIRNSPRLNGLNLLYLTGERREESAARGRYAQVETHKSDARASGRRRVDHWRPILAWPEEQVWDIIRRYQVRAHPCYYLGWSRCSCYCCIFGDPDQWATIRVVTPELFELLAELERQFGLTIHRTQDLHTRADRGTPFTTREEADRSGALQTSYPATDIIMTDWELPSGAYRRGGGPS